VGNDFSNPFLQKEKFQRMKSQQQRVPRSRVPVNSNVPNTQLAPLEKVVDRVNSAVEVTTREFQCLTSWLLHREEHRQKESRGFPHLKGGEDRQSSATEGRRAQPRAKWEDCSQDPNWEEIRRRQSDNERNQECYYPTDRLHSSPLSSSCHNWSNHLEKHKAEHHIPNQKGESKEVTPPFAKKATEPPCTD
jgi:hypothetical protein